jgi:hypothetical protein
VTGSLHPASTIGPLRRRRFLERGDLREKKTEEEEIIARYGRQPLDNRPDIALLTAERREGLIRE